MASQTILLTTFCIQVACVMAYHSCTVQDVTRCLRPMAPYHSDKSIFPTYDDRTLHDICKSFLEMESCLAPIKPACTHHEVQVYEGLEKASNFLCRDGLEQYRNHRVCFADTALTEEGHFCNFTYTQEVERARLNTEPLEERAKKLCENTGKFMECVQKAVRRHCGGGAANWVHSVNLKVFTPFMDSIGCHDHRTSASQSNVPIAIILGVALALFAILLSIIITSIICRRKARQNNSISLNRLNTGTSGTVDNKKSRSDNRAFAKRENNIYSTSPKKMCAVNGNIRMPKIDTDKEELFKDNENKQEELSEIVLIKSSIADDTYERIKIITDSPEACFDDSCHNPEAEQPELDDNADDKNDIETPTKMRKDERVYLLENSGVTREESEHLLPSASDDWKNDSDLDSEGFPPPPPPICESEDDLQANEGPMRANIVNPFHGIICEGDQIWVPRKADPDMTEVKQKMTTDRPPGPILAVRANTDLEITGLVRGKRNSNLYEEEVDRLLELDEIDSVGRSNNAHV